MTIDNLFERIHLNFLDLPFDRKITILIKYFIRPIFNSTINCNTNNRFFLGMLAYFLELKILLFFIVTCLVIFKLFIYKFLLKNIFINQFFGTFFGSR